MWKEVYYGGPEGRKVSILCDGTNHQGRSEHRHSVTSFACDCEQMKKYWPLDIGAKENGAS